MPENSKASRMSTPKAVTVVVRRLTLAGLIVTLPDGREGLIRERELAWDAEARREWRKRHRPGDTLQVVIVKKEADQQLELSLRLAQSDPWQDVKERYPVGVLVEGVVTGIMPYGVFVELEPGVTGLLHRSRFPIWEKREPGAIFWPGDLVKMVVQSSSPTRRRLALSLSEVISHRWRVQATNASHSTRQDALSVPFQPLRSLLQELHERPRKRVLVVEDDPGQRQAVVDWLQHVNQSAEAASCGEEALESVTRIQPDLVLMDVGLPGMSGIQAAQRILEGWPKTRCVLMTDWGRAENYAAELSALADAGVSLMLKPLLPEDLLNALLEATPGIVLPQAKAQVRSRIEQISVAPRQAQKSTLLGSLAQLRSATAADKVVLFEFNPDGRQISVFAQHGTPSLRLNALPEVVHSPVCDVAEDGHIYSMQNQRERPELRMQHLQSLLDFGACLGVPAPTGLRNRYALFLFSTGETVNPDAWLLQAKTTAAAVGLWLERRHFTYQAADMLRVTMLGQLSRALVHEVSGRVTPINLAVERLQAALDVIERITTGAPDQMTAQAQYARHELQNLLQQTQALTKTTRAFSRMARSGQEEILILQEIVDEAVEILHDTASSSHVAVFVHPVPRLYLTRAQVTYFQQTLVNVLQNAIQQISQFRPAQPGRIEVHLTQTIAAQGPILQVRIEDDGPGIHRGLWERIFEADYTTRPDGSGLGLYISRSLIESQGGRIYVGQSYVYWGSTFVVELPIKA